MGARGDLCREDAVAAAEVEDRVGGLGVEPSGDFGRELGDEGGGGGVSLVSANGLALKRTPATIG